jgi:hypothetical protein
MKHQRFEARRSVRLDRPRTDWNQLNAELADLKESMMAKARSRRQDEAAKLSESIRRVVMDLALDGPTGCLARCLFAKHADSLY